MNSGKYIDENGNEHIELYTGKGKYIDSSGIVKYTGTFINGQYFDGNNKLYHIEYDLVVYEGDIKNNKYNGYGINHVYYKEDTRYNNHVYCKEDNNIIIDQIWEGIFVDNRLVEGKLTQYNGGIIYSILDGKYYDNNGGDINENIFINFEGTETHYDSLDIVAPNYNYIKRIYKGTFDISNNLHGLKGEIKNKHGTIIYSGQFWHGLWFDGNNKYYNTDHDVIVFEGNIINNKINGYGKLYGYNDKGDLDYYTEGIFNNYELTSDTQWHRPNGDFIKSMRKNYNGIHIYVGTIEFSKYKTGELIINNTIIVDNKPINYIEKIKYIDGEETVYEYIDNTNELIYTGTFSNCKYNFSNHKLHGEGVVMYKNGNIKYNGTFYYGFYNKNNKLYDPVNDNLVYESLDKDKLNGDKFKIFQDGLLYLDCEINNDTVLSLNCKIYENGLFKKRINFNLSHEKKLIEKNLLNIYILTEFVKNISI